MKTFLIYAHEHTAEPVDFSQNKLWLKKTYINRFRLVSINIVSRARLFTCTTISNIYFTHIIDQTMLSHQDTITQHKTNIRIRCNFGQNRISS